MSCSLLAKLLLATSIASPLVAQDKVNVGAVLKYTGLPSDLDELRDTNLYLRTLESQVASETIGIKDVRYIDRVSVEQVFREKRLSEDAAFNLSSGALRGLLGRLDVLIVIDASDPGVARLRAIDLQDGSVRALDTCKRGMFSSPSTGAADCAKSFASKLPLIVGELGLAKAQRRADEQRVAAQQAALEAKKERLAADQQRAAEADAKVEADAARKKEEQDAKELAEKRVAIGNLQPDLDAAIARLQSADDFWGRMARSLASEGRGLRSDIQTTLRAADSTGKRCRGLSDGLDADGLRACISDLTARLDKLDSYK